MNQRLKLKQDIVEIEDQAGQLDPTDYEELYKLLAVAYFKAKDIIELHDEVNPLVEDTSSELQDLKEAYSLASTQVDIYKEEVEEYKKVVTELTAKTAQILQILV